MALPFCLRQLRDPGQLERKGGKTYEVHLLAPCVGGETFVFLFWRLLLLRPVVRLAAGGPSEAFFNVLTQKTVTCCETPRPRPLLFTAHEKHRPLLRLLAKYGEITWDLTVSLMVVAHHYRPGAVGRFHEMYLGIWGGFFFLIISAAAREKREGSHTQKSWPGFSKLV